MKKYLLAIILFTATTVNFLKAQDLYDLTNITTIELTFTDPNWDATLDSYYSAGLDQRLLATCLVNGIQYDSVGVKYKGNSTYNSNQAKNPLNIKLNYIINNQDYDDYYTLKLSNGKNDPSFVREVLSYEIARKYMQAPLSNYAKVYINGNYHGLYSSSESINKKFVKEKFYSDKDNTLFKCNPANTMNGGSSLEYLGTDSSFYFNYYELQSDYGWNDMTTYTNELNNNFNNIENTWNIDRAIWMLAFDNVLVSLDTYIGPFKQNYYLFKDDHNRFNPIVWDMNESLGGFESINMGGGGPPGPPNVTSLQQLDPLLRLGDNTYPLVNQILSNARYKKMYMAHFRTILEENFVNGEYQNRATVFQNLVSSDVSTDPNAFYTSTEFSNNLTNQIPGQSGAFGITQLMDARVTYLQSNTEYVKVGPVISNIQNNAVAINSNVTITADIANATYAYLGYRNSIEDIFTKTEMFDDGNHNDGAAGDGVFGATIPVGVSDIQYYIYSDNSAAGKFSPQRAEHEYHSLAVSGDVVINEISASNSNVQADPDGEFDDWIELYNNTTSPIVLDGYYLSDNDNNPTKWTFPTGTTINANDYLIVWADNDTMQSGLHANFKLSSSGESVLLSNASSNLIDEVTFGIQTTDITYGRFQNGTGSFIFMNPTFEAENTNTVNVENINREENNFKVYPNPTDRNITIELDNYEEESLYIFNVVGKIVYQKIITDNNLNIDVSDWPKGIYIIKTKNNIQKLIVN
ncbi:MAG: CotH kinase family protein [Vicingaceae bacterium]